MTLTEVRMSRLDQHKKNYFPPYLLFFKFNGVEEMKLIIKDASNLKPFQTSIVDSKYLKKSTAGSLAQNHYYFVAFAIKSNYECRFILLLLFNPLKLEEE